MTPRRVFLAAPLALIATAGLAGCVSRQPTQPRHQSLLDDVQARATVSFTADGGVMVSERFTGVADVTTSVEHHWNFVDRVPVPGGMAQPRSGTLMTKMHDLSVSRNGVAETPAVTDTDAGHAISIQARRMEPGPYEASLSFTCPCASVVAGIAVETFVQVGEIGEVTFNSHDIQLVEILTDGVYCQTGHSTDFGWIVEDFGPDWRAATDMTAPMIFRVTRQMSTITPGDVSYA